MAHFEKFAPRTRISVSTVMMQPGQSLELFVWGWVEGLAIRSTDESVVKVSKALTKDGRCAIQAVSPHKLQVPKIELVMAGQAVWDYFEVSVLKGALPPGFDQQQNYVHPGSRRVQVAAFWSKNAAPNTFARSAEISRLILARHGLKLEVTPGSQPSGNHVLPFDEVVKFGGQIETLREQVEATGLAANRLIAINVPCADKLDGAVDDNSTPFGWQFPASGRWAKPFVVINSAKWSGAGVTLLHEIGHAAGLGHEYSKEGSTVANFMNEPSFNEFAAPGTSMYRKQVIAIANAFFTTG